MPLSKEVDPNESQKIIRNVNGTDSPELNQLSNNGSSVYFDGLSMKVRTEKKHKRD